MNKKQIGILTFHYAVNPGSALQAYALWSTINALSSDVDCHIINYQSTRYRNLFVKIPQKLSLKKFAWWLLKSLWYCRYQRYWKEIGEALKPMHRIDEKSLASINGYEYIVVGSDQVWNTKLTNRNFNYFLPFISGSKKIAYAASIGLSDFPEEDKHIIASLLRDFSCISVREPSARIAVENLIGTSPQVVVDPSLLLKKEQWEDFAVHPRLKKKYVFIYLRHKDSKIVSCAKKMADSLGLQIVECHNGFDARIKDSVVIRQPNPRKWLGWILNAECVFTDSYHGCAFCIKLNKPFFVMISSANSEMSSRIINILERYNMTDRLVAEQSDTVLIRNMSFEDSNRMLDQDRKTAIDYLKYALKLKA